MKKNAFTLIELIATIGLLGMLSTILITVSVRKINETKEKSRNTMIESIELAAINYVTDYKDELSEFNSNDYIYISLQTLVENEYFTESLVDQTTDKTLPLSDKVYITRENNGKINASYDIEQRGKTKIILNGPYNHYIEKSDTYDDLGVTATDKNGKDVTNKVVVSGSINMAVPGKYEITYEYDGTVIKRNVFVQDNIVSFASGYLYELLKNEETLNNGLVQTAVPYKNDDGIEIIIDAGIRYAGADEDVNNKVYFNCKDIYNNIKYGSTRYDYKNACEIWRIIGVFDVNRTIKSNETEKRIKIISEALVDSNDNIIKMSYDSSADGSIEGETNVNNGKGINQWGLSKYVDGRNYEGADIMRILNTYYLGTTTKCTYCDGANQLTCSKDCTDSIMPLSSTSINMIDNAVWSTRGIKWGSTSSLDSLYNSERTGQQTGKICKSLNGDGTENTECNDVVTRTIEWEGKVGLIYPSDWGYASSDEECEDIKNANGTCKINNWLKSSSNYWVISAVSDNARSSLIWYANLSGGVYSGHMYGANAIRPSVYLSYDVQIIDGNGQDEPYILKKETV